MNNSPPRSLAHDWPLRPPLKRRHWLAAAAGWALAPGARAQASPTASARRLSFEHTHTGERLSLVYALGDQVLDTALAQLNRFMRDHYSAAVGQMDPQLFHLLHRLQLTLGTDTPFQIISGYRSPATNQTLRTTRGGGVAKHSLHMEGRAIDLRLPGVPLADVRDAARDLRLGGVGYYAHEQFVHVDTGRVRAW